MKYDMRFEMVVSKNNTLSMRKLELIDGKISDIKEISLHHLWRLAFPMDFPDNKSYREAIGMVKELYRDHVLTEYQYSIIAAAIGLS